jgi:hypothetical protein
MFAFDVIPAGPPGAVTDGDDQLISERAHDEQARLSLRDAAASPAGTRKALVGVSQSKTADDFPSLPATLPSGSIDLGQCRH